MNRYAWICAWAALGCGGDDGNTRSGGDLDGGMVGRDGGSGGPSVSGGARADAGNDAPDGGATRDAGTAGASRISALTAAEHDGICRTHVDAFFAPEWLASECAILAVLDTDDQTSCDAYAAECLAEYRSTVESDKAEAQRECLDALAGCEYTLEELERCALEHDAAWRRTTERYACSRASEHGPDEDVEPDFSAACQNLLDTCYSW
ncbi:MAG: hypothetical protein ABW252_12780 [Polyangiales bacterium]